MLVTVVLDVAVVVTVVVVPSAKPCMACIPTGASALLPIGKSHLTLRFWTLSLMIFVCGM
jgi:hypothetical protein